MECIKRQSSETPIGMWFVKENLPSPIGDNKSFPSCSHCCLLVSRIQTPHCQGSEVQNLRESERLLTDRFQEFSNLINQKPEVKKIYLEGIIKKQV